MIDDLSMWDSCFFSFVSPVCCYARFYSVGSLLSGLSSLLLLLLQFWNLVASYLFLWFLLPVAWASLCMHSIFTLATALCFWNATSRQIWRIRSISLDCAFASVIYGMRLAAPRFLVLLVFSAGALLPSLCCSQVPSCPSYSYFLSLLWAIPRFSNLLGLLLQHWVSYFWPCHHFWPYCNFF